jgi:hypothetical protein
MSYSKNSSGQIIDTRTGVIVTDPVALANIIDNYSLTNATDTAGAINQAGLGFKSSDIGVGNYNMTEGLDFSGLFGNPASKNNLSVGEGAMQDYSASKFNPDGSYLKVNADAPDKIPGMFDGLGQGIKDYGGIALGAAGLGANIYFANKNQKLLESQDKWNRDRTTIADNNTKAFASRVGGTYSTTV